MTVTDKHRAVKGKYRFSEKSLMLFGILGGALPMLLTMLLIHHKTRKKKFMMGLPAIIVLHIVFLLSVWYFTCN